MEHRKSWVGFQRKRSHGSYSFRYGNQMSKEVMAIYEAYHASTIPLKQRINAYYNMNIVNTYAWEVWVIMNS